MSQDLHLIFSDANDVKYLRLEIILVWVEVLSSSEFIRQIACAKFFVIYQIIDQRCSGETTRSFQIVFSLLTTSTYEKLIDNRSYNLKMTNTLQALKQFERVIICLVTCCNSFVAMMFTTHGIRTNYLRQLRTPLRWLIEQNFSIHCFLLPRRKEVKGIASNGKKRGSLGSGRVKICSYRLLGSNSVSKSVVVRRQVQQLVIGARTTAVAQSLVDIRYSGYFRSREAKRSLSTVYMVVLEKRIQRHIYHFSHHRGADKTLK